MKISFGTNGKFRAELTERATGFVVVLYLNDNLVDEFTVHEWEFTAAAMTDLAKKVRNAATARHRRTHLPMR